MRMIRRPTNTQPFLRGASTACFLAAMLLICAYLLFGFVSGCTPPVALRGVGVCDTPTELRCAGDDLQVCAEGQWTPLSSTDCRAQGGVCCYTHQAYQDLNDFACTTRERCVPLP